MTRRQLLFSYAVFVVLASLDNAAAGVLPPLYAIIARDLQANEAALGGVTAIYILILAAAAAFWGYRGDQGQRKSLLLYWHTHLGQCHVLYRVSSNILAVAGRANVNGPLAWAVSPPSVSVLSATWFLPNGAA